jgi:hypothetical protein
VTQQEHRFVMLMMGSQYTLTMTLFQILKSRDLAEDADLAPFYDLMKHEAPDTSLQGFFAMYRQQAESCGLHIAP